MNSAAAGVIVLILLAAGVYAYQHRAAMGARAASVADWAGAYRSTTTPDEFRLEPVSAGSFSLSNPRSSATDPAVLTFTRPAGAADNYFINSHWGKPGGLGAMVQLNAAAGGPQSFTLTSSNGASSEFRMTSWVDGGQWAGNYTALTFDSLPDPVRALEFGPGMSWVARQHDDEQLTRVPQGYQKYLVFKTRGAQFDLTGREPTVKQGGLAFFGETRGIKFTRTLSAVGWSGVVRVKQ